MNELVITNSKQERHFELWLGHFNPYYDIY